MGYDRTAAKRSINVILSDDLVRQAALHTGNLSSTLDDLLDDYVARERARRLDEEMGLSLELSLRNTA